MTGERGASERLMRQEDEERLEKGNPVSLDKDDRIDGRRRLPKPDGNRHEVNNHNFHLAPFSNFQIRLKLI